MKLTFSDEHGASKKAQKLSLDILKFSSEFGELIKRVQDKKGLWKHYEKNKGSYDLAVDELMQAKKLMIEASGHLIGGRELYVL